MSDIFTKVGDKYIPLRRFNLKAARVSTAFGKTPADEKAFVVKAHPIVQSIEAASVERPIRVISRPTSVDLSRQPPTGSHYVRPAVTRPTIAKHLTIADRQTKIKHLGHLEKIIEHPKEIEHLKHYKIIGGPKEIEHLKIIENPLEIELPKKFERPTHPVTPAIDETAPLVENASQLTPDSVVRCVGDNKKGYMFPDIKLSPYEGTLFYYERYKDEKGQSRDEEGEYLIGRVTLVYELVDKANSAGYNRMPIEIAEAKLNLKVDENRTITIDGVVDRERKKFTFEIQKNAVSIAFHNLKSEFENRRCNIDVYFRFSGYERRKRPVIIGSSKSVNDAIASYERRKEIIQLLSSGTHADVMRENLMSGKRRFLSIRKVRAISVDTPEQTESTQEIKKYRLQSRSPEHMRVLTQEVMVKTTFHLKINKQLYYPFDDKNRSLYKADKDFDMDLFKFDDKFSEYRQIFCPGISAENVVIYKSDVAPNSFLLFPKRYYLARNEESPCISAQYFVATEGVVESQQELARFGFSFTVSPDLSDLELAKMKRKLYENNFLNNISAKNIWDDVRFDFPNDIGADVSITGNELFAAAEVAKDGRNFNLSFKTEKLGIASRLITSINSSIAQYFNITSTHREICGTANAELHIEKTIGSYLEWKVEGENLILTNQSLSPCRILNIMLVDENGEVRFNTEYFKQHPDINNEEERTVEIRALAKEWKFSKIVNVFLEYESIEDISKEFKQFVDEIESYYRSVILDFSNVRKTIDKKDIASMQLDVFIETTKSTLSFEKKREDFSQPLLVTFVVINENERNTKLKIVRKYFDISENMIGNDELIWDYSKGATIDLNSKKQA